jgi:predicted RNA-binding Zn ribbon-like protein
MLCLLHEAASVKPANALSPVYDPTMPNERIDFVHPALDLVNSQHGEGPDLLEDPVWLGDFLAHWGYASAGSPRGGERRGLVALRAVMRRIVEAVSRGESPAPSDLDGINRFLRRGRLAPALETDGADFELRLVPVRRDWPSVRSELASALAELLSRGEPDRLKVCDNVQCRFAFYDASRNRSRRWCSHTTCGNRHKVTRFRARRRRESYSASR